MKALVYTDVETLEYHDVPRPVPGDDEDLIRIMASGICGSDMHAFLGHDARRPAPLILGHEASGLVVGGPNDGRRVTINPLVTCGTCKACASGCTNLCGNRQIISMPPRAGAFAEYVAMPRDNLVTVPEEIPLVHAALAEPLACGWHGVRMGLAAQSTPASALRGLAIGGGAIGFGAALAMKAQGLTDITVVESNSERREFLTQHCSFSIVPPEGLNPDALFDLVVDGVGFAATRTSASAMTCPGGAIVHIGLGEDTGGLDIRRMTLQEISFIGTYTYTVQDFVETAQAIFNGDFGALDWTTLRPLSEGAQAFQRIRSGKAAAPKTILTPPSA